MNHLQANYCRVLFILPCFTLCFFFFLTSPVGPMQFGFHGKWVCRKLRIQSFTRAGAQRQVLELVRSAPPWSRNMHREVVFWGGSLGNKRFLGKLNGNRQFLEVPLLKGKPMCEHYLFTQLAFLLGSFGQPFMRKLGTLSMHTGLGSF